MAVRQRTRSKIYELYVELEGIEPLIWRRLLVPATITLPKLHDLLQLAMGWTNSHLHSFTIENRTFGMADVDNFEELDMLDERRHTLAAVLGASTREFLYLYDFGDSWHHRITVKTLAHPNPDWHYPLCTGGARAAPPDDVGGPPGYENSSLPSTTRNTRSTIACSPGSAARLILRASTSTPSIGCCASGDREMRKSLSAAAYERWRLLHRRAVCSDSIRGPPWESGLAHFWQADGEFLCPPRDELIHQRVFCTWMR